MPLLDLMTRPVITVPPSLPLGEALETMISRKFSCLVIGDGRRALGIVTERDVVRAYSRIHDHPELTVADVMTAAPLMVPQEMDHYEAFKVMKSRRFRHLLVSDGDGALAGIVTETDFVRHLGVDFYVRPKDVMSVMAPVICVDERMPLGEVAGRLAKPGIFCVVVERAGQAIGILTERDIVRLLRPGGKAQDEGLTVGDVMSTPLITIPPEACLLDASEALRCHDIRHVVVVNQDGEAKGVVSEHEMVLGLESEYVVHLEDIINQKNAALADLAASHEELREFARIASHDLQEPTRTLVSFCQLLLRRHSDQLDAEGRELLGFVIDGARRMHKQVSDLATYTLAAAPPEGDETSDAAEAAAAVAARLQEVIDQVGADVSIAALPRVRLPRNHMVALLSELVDNALRFGRPGVPLRIHIGAESDGGGWRLSVADNGIGIDPAYYGDIFRLFTRLQPASSPAGTGAGLAICKRIVASVRGRIWVESTPGQGSTFHFTLPRAD
jgi:CBS domain-containing protein/two-component sensor histidine kinase